MTSNKKNSMYLNPQEFFAKDDNRSSISTNPNDESVYVPISQFEVSTNTNRGNKLQTLEDKLSRGWFFIYKSFIFITMCVDILGVVYESFTAIVNISSHVLIDVIVIALLVWEAAQLFVEFKAIHYADKNKAEKAVKLIKYYMVVVGISAVIIRFLMINQMTVVEHENLSFAREFMKMFGFIIGIEMIIYFCFLFGAIKVRNVLNEIALLRGSQFIHVSRSQL